MLSKSDKKEIVNKLNKLFTNYEELKFLCNFLCNDLNKVIETISKIIKYAFVDQSFIYWQKSLGIILQEITDVDDKYKLYLIENNKKNIFSFFKAKQEVKINISIPFDKDIKVSDLEGLIVPTVNEIESICNSNLKQINEDREKKIKRDNFLKQKKNI